MLPQGWRVLQRLEVLPQEWRVLQRLEVLPQGWRVLQRLVAQVVCLLHQDWSLQ